MAKMPLFDWKPPAELVLFPSVCRRRMIERAAESAARSKNPENTVRATIERTRRSHDRKGLAPDIVDRDISELEAALRTQIAFTLARHGVAR
jgi:hypothetical protein